MGPKKQPKKGGKGQKQAEEEDLSTKEFLNYYKKSCKELDFPLYKPLEQKIYTLLDESQHLNEILIIEQLGPIGLKTITKALKATK